MLESIERISLENNAPSIIYVTHHVEEILPTFSKTLLLKKGQVFSQGLTKEMVESENLSQFFGLPVEVDWSEQRPTLKKK